MATTDTPVLSRKLPITSGQNQESACKTLRPPSSGLWSIVLSGGEGSRMRPFIEEQFGRHLPKQYCTFTGTRSLLQHTLDRIGHLASDDHTIIVIDQSHISFAEFQLSTRPFIRVIHQPRNLDTAPGIFLPLTYVRLIDPKATVIIHPSDHFVFPEERYIAIVREILAESSSINNLILLGVIPDRLELEYGWVIPGPMISKRWPCIYSVQSFVEKPTLAKAEAAMNSGAFWNTFVLIGKAEFIWNLGRKYLPEMMSSFDLLADAIGSAREAEVISSIYEKMPKSNFSSDLLQRASEFVDVAKLEGITWSDWGNCDRVLDSLKKIRSKPASPDNFLFKSLIS